MERIKAALSAIRADSRRAEEIIALGVREAPEIFVPALARFVASALTGVVLDPEDFD